MRRLAVPFAAFTLAGCSGFGQFTHDTFTLPGANPDLPAGASENMLRAQARPTTIEPLATEPGNVWPGPPKPFPTLGEVEKQTQNGQVSASPGDEGTGPGVGPSAFNPSNGQTSGSRFKMEPNPNAPSTITIPNGNGTSTVIAPDGSVKVIPTPKGSGASGQ